MDDKADRKGLILFAHGARDPRWAEPFERLRALLQEQVPTVPVALAYLELMQPDLSTAVSQLFTQGCTALKIVPVFFGQGGHIRRDLPALIERLRTDHPGRIIEATAAVGEDEKVLLAIAAYCLRQLKP